MDKFLDFNTGEIIFGKLDIKTKDLEVNSLTSLGGDITLTPKVSSLGPEGTIFYCSNDDHVYVATE